MVSLPTAATLHAMHYHQHNVFALQDEIKQRVAANVDDILCPPLHTEPKSLTQGSFKRSLIIMRRAF